MDDVSIIIPTLDGGARLREVMARVAGQRTARPVERVLIDSGSRDGTLEAAHSLGFRVLPIPKAEFNHGATRDRAIRATHGRLVVLLVQDAVPANEHWLEELVGPLEADAEAAGAFSRQVPIPGGNPILEHRLRHWIAGKDEARRMQLGPGRRWEDLDPLQRLETIAFDNVSSAVRRKVWELHPFGHRPFGEDLAWSTWAIRAGHALRFHPASVVEHSHDRSAWHEARRIYCDHRNLNELLGLVTVPTLRAALRGRKAALAHYRSILEAAELSGPELRRRRRWARQYALGEVLAQWLAPRVNRAGGRGLLGVLDRRLRRGI